MAHPNPKAEVLAAEFAKRLREEMTPKEFEEMRRLNAEETDPSVCHSHDFLDANMTMHEAMWNVLGREPDLGDDDDDTALWNDAWDLAAVEHLGRKKQ